jgi:uronate dehydrogenase
MPLRPDSYYAVTKAFGEALARLYHDKHGISGVLVRIGSFQERPRDRRMLATWLSHRDAVHLFQRAVEAENVGCAIVCGISANRCAWVDTSGAEAIGDRPEDDAEAFADELDGPWPDFQGGDYCHRDG